VDETTGEANRPMFLFYFGFEKYGMNYKRQEYGLMQLVSKAGGFVVAVWRTLLLVVYLITLVNVKT